MDQPIQKALRKAKIKQLLKITIISLVVFFVLLVAFYRIGNHFASKSTHKLHDSLFLYHDIAQPNVRINSQVTSNSSMFGGNIITNRSKDVDGYLVPWSTLTSSYDWFRGSVDSNELIPGFYWGETLFYEYDKQTKQKVATFYHPEITNYYDGVQNQLNEISQMTDYVAEVAISFKKPLTIHEIQSNIPTDKFNIQWLYMTSRIVDESNGPSGLPVFGYNDSGLSKEAFNSFIDNLKRYDSNSDIEEIQKFIRENASKPFDEVPVLGVMLTGRAENFKLLNSKDFIRGASIGVTAPIVPYIKPIK